MGFPRSGTASADQEREGLSHLREWLVGGAVIEGPQGLLLVRNRRHDGSFDWSPPGGVIDEGETVVDGLSREVTEETGLVVTRWSGKLYEIEAHAPDMGWTLRVEAWLAHSWEGELRFDDPDGIVETAAWVPADDCGDHLADVARWVSEPVLEWTTDRWSDIRSFSYRIDGADRSSLVVTRV